MNPFLATFAAVVTALCLFGCSRIDGVVKDIRLNDQGDLLVTKCDEKIVWNFLFLAGSEANCRDEIKPAPKGSR